MDKMRIPLHLCGNNLRRWINNPRYYIVAVLALVWVHYLISPIKAFSQSVGVNATIWGFPFLLTAWYPHMVLLLGAVLLFCDAPFMNNGTPYECIRSGKRAWTHGQLVYVVVASIIFVLYLFLAIVVCLLPNVTLSTDWGKVYSTLAQTNVGSIYSLIPISYLIQQTYTPLQAMILSGSLLTLETCLIGTVMFFINSITSRAVGVFCGLVLSFFPAFASVAGGTLIYYLLPTTWANISILDTSGKSLYPPVSYAVLLLLLLNVILMTVSSLLARKKQIEVLMPV